MLKATSNEFKATATAQGGSNTLREYYFSNDNGTTWEKEETTATSVTHIFTGSTASTEYKVKVYVVDIQSEESEKYPSGEGVAVTTSDYIKPNVTALTVDSNSIKYNGFTVTATATAGTVPIKNYYFSVSTDNNTWTNESAAQTTNSYTFTNLNGSTGYYVKVRVVDNNDQETSYTTTSMTTTPEVPVILASKIKGLYSTDGINNLYKHDRSGSYTNAAQESGGGEYRFAGSSESTNNYVCFGSTANTCSTDNLYRIIGVFGDRVKLIKSDYATSTLLGTGGDYQGTGTYNSTYKGSQSTAYWYYWNNATSKNTWSDSQLNKTHLNTNFLNNIGIEWANLIDTTTWYVGGMSRANGATASNIAKTTYNYEVGAYKTGTTYSAKVGLMYMSDYYYAAAPTYWSYIGYESSETNDYRAAVNENWMYMGENEWSISRRSENTDDAFIVNNSGYVNYNRYVYIDYYAVRPSFYLKSDVTTTGGTGTSDSPYRILLRYA